MPRHLTTYPLADILRRLTPGAIVDTVSIAYWLGCSRVTAYKRVRDLERLDVLVVCGTRPTSAAGRPAILYRVDGAALAQARAAAPRAAAWVTIAEILADVGAGGLPRDSLTARALSDYYGVTRATARRLLSRLVAAGSVTQRAWGKPKRGGGKPWPVYRVRRSHMMSTVES